MFFSLSAGGAPDTVLDAMRKQLDAIYPVAPGNEYARDVGEALIDYVRARCADTPTSVLVSASVGVTLTREPPAGDQAAGRGPEVHENVAPADTSADGASPPAP